PYHRSKIFAIFIISRYFVSKNQDFGTKSLPMKLNLPFRLIRNSGISNFEPINEKTFNDMT
ncbi:MAG: hypothetical protein K2H01_12405, partial [Ruminococcus sp.]|nr:hypothetical protein [Ruminococcus sp.]